MTLINDPTLSFSYIIDIGEYNNSKIIRAILLRTKQDYRRTLKIFDKLVLRIGNKYNC
jgi:hypothetical protein